MLYGSAFGRVRGSAKSISLPMPTWVGPRTIVLLFGCAASMRPPSLPRSALGDRVYDVEPSTPGGNSKKKLPPMLSPLSFSPIHYFIIK